MSEFLGIDIKTLYDCRFQFCQTVLIRKVLEATRMEHSNGLLTPTKVEAPLGTDANDYVAKMFCSNSYTSVTGMMYQTQDHIYPFLLTSVPGLHITPRHHMRQL